MHDLIIIGGGPAGITAGIYAARKKLNTLLITRDFFGQIGSTGRVDNWPGEMAVSGMVLMQKLEKHLRGFEIEIKTNEKVFAIESRPGGSFSLRTDKNAEYAGKALIIATGRSARKLNIEGEKEFLGKGLSYCSICDAPFFKDKQVAVIGGGNAGFEAALDLAKYAKKVFIFDNGSRFSADELLQTEAKDTGIIDALLNTELRRIEGKGKVQAIVYENLVDRKVFQQPMEGVFAQIGSLAASEFLGKLVKLNKSKEISVNPLTMETSRKGIFAPGDCNDTKFKQMIVAAGQGAVAALSAYEYLRKS
ncbi:MAG: FAD-dependent oxidoreductase [Candidatus Pacebacteria bacterium]|nr:FAD-dependent oxidoreductase [Candidatus Paceibacterota bacterium]